MVKKTREAFTWIIKILRKSKIPYWITGGFAARIYGSKRPLADIDIEVHDKDIDRITPLVKKYILRGPLNYKDSQYDIYALFIEYHGQKIDVCGTDSQRLFNKKIKKWEKENRNLRKAIKKKIYGLLVSVVPLKDLINYKKRMSRRVDIEDVKQLTKST